MGGSLKIPTTGLEYEETTFTIQDIEGRAIVIHDSDGQSFRLTCAAILKTITTESDDLPDYLNAKTSSSSTGFMYFVYIFAIILCTWSLIKIASENRPITDEELILENMNTIRKSMAEGRPMEVPKLSPNF